MIVLVALAPSAYAADPEGSPPKPEVQGAAASPAAAGGGAAGSEQKSAKKSKKTKPAKHWTGKKPPKGWNEEAYSPKNEDAPDFGEDYKPKGDEKYDPRTDDFHPLKDPTSDPGKEWEGSHGSNLNQTFVAGGEGDWDWGERYYGASFTAPLEINNRCETPQQVGIFVTETPFLTFPKTVTVPQGKTTVIGQIQLPPEPDPPINVGMPGAPGWGHVDFGPIIIPPGMFPPPQLHQPNFAKLGGQVVVWHPWNPAADCNAARITHVIAGHIHFSPPAPKGGGPQELAKADVCTVYWLTGEPPAQLGDTDCTEPMRELAAAFVERTLAPYILNAPGEWLWLPGSEDIASMSISGMLHMKLRAEAVMGTGKGAREGVSLADAPGDAPAGPQSKSARTIAPTAISNKQSPAIEQQTIRGSKGSRGIAPSSTKERTGQSDRGVLVPGGSK